MEYKKNSKALQQQPHNRKIIRLTESHFRNLIDGSISQLLTEERASKSVSAAKKYVMKRFGWDYATADKFVTDVRKKFSTLNYNDTATYFIPGLVRMYIDDNLKSNSDLLNKLNIAMRYVISNEHYKDFEGNWNLINPSTNQPMSAEDLIGVFQNEINSDKEQTKNKINSMQFKGKSDYDIVRIDSFEQVNEYRKYTAWCITEDKDAFDRYTTNDTNQFYFCLKKGFESVPREIGENCPLDEYGLSMIAVLVGGDGNLVHCTCRWNHENGGNDNVMNEAEISEVVNMDFEEVFKPNNKWKITVDNAMQRIKNGEDPEYVFDECDEFSEGYARIKLNGKYNLISTKGNLASPSQWFDYCSNFKNGYAMIELNEKYNWIDTKGTPLYKKPVDQWFDDCGLFYDGYARVELDNKQNLIDKEGNFVYNEPVYQWFDYCDDFYRGWAKVKLDDKWNFIDTEGNFLYYKPLDQWFDECDDLYEFDYINECYALVKYYGRYNWITTKGRLLSPNIWFDYCSDFDDDYAQVELNDKRYIIDAEGNLYDYKTREPLEINPNTMQTNESIMNRLTNMIAEKVIRRIQR